ncbi:MAG: homoserine acetyltransferase, partial [Acidobacteriota bacterium]|nr:homoserine acetyltransferase [Acidobacteriota bacterium]
MIRKILFVAGLAFGCYGTVLGQAGAAPLEPVQHEFTIKSFKTESGAVLPEAKIVYGTYGKLNAAGDNAVLLPSHYMAEMHGYGWLIGTGKALD